MPHIMPMVDMALSPKEAKAEAAVVEPAESSSPKYPWNLCLCLQEEQLAKLNLKALPAVGEMIHLFALAKVTSITSNERQGSDGAAETDRRVELQITHLAVESEDAENAETDRIEARRSRMYGTTDYDAGAEG